MQKVLDFIEKVLKGMIVGIAAMTAGAGTFAIVLGIYDRCMEIIANPFKKFKENLIYVLPIVIGICISALFCGKLVIFMLNEYESYVKYAFLGIILGGVPTLFQRANAKGKDKKYIIALVLAAICTMLMTAWGNSVEEREITRQIGWLELFAYGLLYAFGAVMPGMTTIHILMFLGVLAPIMSGIFALDLSVIIPFGIGYLIMVLGTANLITFLFKKFYGYTYYAIIGFSILSLQMLVPPLMTTKEKILCPIIALVATAIMYGITRLDDILANKRENKNEIQKDENKMIEEKAK